MNVASLKPILGCHFGLLSLKAILGCHAGLLRSRSQQRQSDIALKWLFMWHQATRDSCWYRRTIVVRVSHWRAVHTDSRYSVLPKNCPQRVAFPPTQAFSLFPRLKIVVSQQESVLLLCTHAKLAFHETCASQVAQCSSATRALRGTFDICTHFLSVCIPNSCDQISLNTGLVLAKKAALFSDGSTFSH